MEGPMTSCFYCGSEKFLYILKLISSGKPLPVPHWLPQIKQTCTSCGKFKKFATQDQGLIAEFNKQLEKVKVIKEGIGVMA